MQTKPIAVRFTDEDVRKISKFVGAGYAMNSTDYIRRAVREQIIRDSASMAE